MDINLHVTKALDILLLLVGPTAVLQEIDMADMHHYVSLYYATHEGLKCLYIEHQYHGNVFRYKKDGQAFLEVAEEYTEPFEVLFTLPICQIRLDKYQYVLATN